MIKFVFFNPNLLALSFINFEKFSISPEIISAIKVKAKELSTEFEKIQEEKLSGLREQVAALNEEMKGILKEDDINSFSEATLNFWVEQYENQKENIEQNVIKKPVQATNQYSQEETETKDPIDGLLDFVNKL